MLTRRPTPLTAEERAELEAAAIPPPSLIAYTALQAAKAFLVGAALLVGIGAVLGLALYLAGGFEAAAEKLPGFGILGSLLLLGTTGFHAWRAEPERAAKATRARVAERALAEGVAEEIVLTLDAESFGLWHEHGVFVVTGRPEGGSVLLDVSTIADDGREPLARALIRDAPLAADWRWRRIPEQGACRGLASSGAETRVTLYEETDPQALLDAFARPGGVVDMQEFDAPPERLRERLAERLRRAG